MGRFIQRVEYVPDDNIETKAGAVVDVLNATFFALREQYSLIFNGLDDVIRACNSVTSGCPVQLEDKDENE